MAQIRETMERIISQLLVVDTDVIKKATAELQEAYKLPETIPALCDLVVSSDKTQVRQYSAILLKKRLAKLRQWQEVPQDQQVIIKQGMLKALIQEKEKIVRNAIAQFIGVLIRHEADKNSPWTQDLLQFVFSQCAASDPSQSELGTAIFATLTDVAPEQFVPHFEPICEIFNAALMAAANSGNLVTPVTYNILCSMNILTPFVAGHYGAEVTYQKILPVVVKALSEFAVREPDQFLEVFDVLENMVDHTPKLLTAYVRPLVEFCLEVSKNKELDDSVRIKVVSFIGWLVRLKKKAIIKQKLVQPIVEVIFDIMATPSDTPEIEDDYFLDDGNCTPSTAATQTMDLMGLQVPAERLIPHLLQLLEPAFRGTDPWRKKAAYLSMAVIAEGCSETICNKYLDTMLNIVKAGLADPNPVVRSAAFFALGQFSEHFQPHISKYAPEILPIIFEFLQQLCNDIREGKPVSKHVDRMFYALETICDNLEDAIVPHLPLLMEKLFQTLDANNSAHLREMALDVIASVTNSAKEHMMPYFNQLIELLRVYLTPSDNEDIKLLRPSAVDTLAAVGRKIGKNYFMPLVNDTMQFSLTFLEEADDPELRRALYNLIGSLAEVLNEEMSAVYPKIMDRLYESVISTDEVIPNFKDDIIPSLPAEDDNKEIDIEFSNDEDDDDDGIAGYSVENSYLEEKEQAIVTLKDFANSTGAAFIPYLEQSFKNVYQMINHPQENVRKVSIESLVAFVIALHKHNDSQAVLNAVTILIPKMEQIVREDEDLSVVLSALDGYAELLKELKGAAIPNDQLKDAIFTSIHDVLVVNVACQFNESGVNGAGGDEDDEESEYEEAVIESAGNILPLFGKALTPEQFAVYFGRLFQVMLQKLQKVKKDKDIASQRCFIYGALAECFAPLQSCVEMYFDTLLPVMLFGITDENDQVRQNAVFGLGELILHAQAKSYESFPQILNALSNVVSAETEPATLDNVCGAIARLILTNPTLVPLQHVLPVFLQKLPLREDFEENALIFKCFKMLYLNCRDSIVDHLEHIVAIAVHVLYKKEFIDEETYQTIIGIMKEVRDNYPDKYAAVANSNAELVAFLNTI